jgi:hypothetical protein
MLAILIFSAKTTALLGRVNGNFSDIVPLLQIWMISKRSSKKETTRNLIQSRAEK